MTERILVAYASRYGSTEEIARVIADEIRDRGYEVDCINVMEVEDVTPYAAVVAGSPIYMGKWLPEAVDLAKHFRVELNERPLAAFAVGYSMKEESDLIRKSARASMNELRMYVHPQTEGTFAGKFDPEGMSTSDLQIMKMARAAPGDARDWTAIRNWARALPSVLFTLEEQA
ncbi:menaquinone-dependent protoporphyrinogen oxidase [Methanofollis sp. W23]|uniref:flavodoxin domain-containing protein n=1 Tax=Methanofollis sp. W23 TaxID=2817849 RepID=UPI001AE586E6|nr:flavodoxin domain-containing protein [Methanofollis sp. W23]MBP2144819.1 menaquinone-dependent protoporphyrinogen oxidase [Methanofollis sp. W23]